MMAMAEQPTTPMQQDPPEVQNGHDTNQGKRALKACFATALRTDTVIQVFGPYIASQEEERVKQTEICARKFRDHYNSFNGQPDAETQSGVGTFKIIINAWTVKILSPKDIV